MFYFQVHARHKNTHYNKLTLLIQNVCMALVGFILDKQPQEEQSNEDEGSADACANTDDVSNISVSISPQVGKVYIARRQCTM